jgi:AraC-like DNA-binding protein
VKRKAMWQRVQGVGEAFGLGVNGTPAAPLGQFNTDLVPAKLRADYYRAMLQGLVCAATPSLARNEDAPRVRTSNGRLGEVLFVHFGATAHRIERGRAEIRSSPNGCYFLLRQTAAGPGLFELGGRQVMLAPGDCLMGDADEPFIAHSDAGFGYSLYLAPKWTVDPWLSGGRDLMARGAPLSASSPLGALISAWIDALSGAGTLAEPTAAGVGAILGRLAAVAAQDRPFRAEPMREAARTARRAQILAEIDRRFDEPLFGPEDVARALGVSVRSVHLALEPTGLSFSAHLASRRLAEGRMLLAQAPERTVADVAFACGFNDVSTFYRSFRRTFGAPPRDLITPTPARRPPEGA